MKSTLRDQFLGRKSVKTMIFEKFLAYLTIGTIPMYLTAKNIVDKTFFLLS